MNQVTSSTDDADTRLGDQLIAHDVVTQVVIDYARQKQKIEGGSLGRLLMELGFASGKDIGRALARQWNIRFVDVALLPVPEVDVASAFNRNVCLTHRFLPLRHDGEFVEVVIGDATPEAIADVVRRRIGMPVRFLQGEFDKVAALTQQHYYFAENPPEKLINSEVRRLEADVDRAYSPGKLLDYILHLAVRERATDVHIAPTAHSSTVLMRVDGVMRPMFALSRALDRLVSFVKLQSEMDASEQRLPQDGSFTATVLETAYTIRVSTLISELGERMVMRLLPERGDLDKLEDLGFLPEDVLLMTRVFARPHGLILITGPTGSGKSTTLHAALRMQPLVERNVVTVEDPVEYRVPVACQTQVNRRAGYDFSIAMRHFLRHDPDIILVGEIRDAETARAALDASSTGHLVLSTLHVGGIFGVVPRLKLLGVDGDTIAENLVAVINQRLVRRICPDCRIGRPATAAEQAWLGAPSSTLFHGAGCSHCRGSGFLGRLPVYEMMIVQRDLADAIAADRPRGILRDIAERDGLRPIVKLSRQRVLAGETTVEEIERAVGNY